MTLILGGFACCNLAVGFAVGRYVQRVRQATLDAWTAPLLHPLVQEPQQPETTPVKSAKRATPDDLAGFLS